MVFTSDLDPSTTRARAMASDTPMDDLDAEARNVSGLIFQMTTHVSAFRRSVDVLGTGKDTRELRVKLHESRMCDSTSLTSPSPSK